MTKLRFWDRIWSALMGLICIALAAVLVLNAGDWLPVEQIKSAVASLSLKSWQSWTVWGVCALILVLVGLRGISVLFRRNKDKGFVIQHTEYGDMSISMKAMENMVKRCIDSHGELTINQTKIYLVRNGVSVDLKITLAAGVNIPLTVNALQKQIKQYITSCSGVDVHEVRVKVETDAVKLLTAPQTPALEAEPAEVIKRVDTPAEPVIQHKEELADYAKPVAEMMIQQEAQADVLAEEQADKQNDSTAEAESDAVQQLESDAVSAGEDGNDSGAEEEAIVNA